MTAPSPPIRVPTDAELEQSTPSELLLLSAALGRTDLAVSALRAGAAVDDVVPSSSSHARTALHAALSGGHVDVARALLAAGASLTKHDAGGETPIAVAAEDEAVQAALSAHVCQRAAAGDSHAIAEAIAAGMDVGKADGSPAVNTPLHWAAAFGQVSAVRELLQAGVDVDAANAKGDTPLRDAAAAGHVAVVRELVSAGADPSLKNKKGSSPIDVATSDELLGALHRSQQGEREVAEHAVGDVEGEDGPETPYFVPGERARGGARPARARAEERPAWGEMLWPRPQRFVEAAPKGFFTLPPVVTVSAENECMQVALMLVTWMRTEKLGDDYTVKLVGGGHGGLGEALEFSASVFLRVDARGVEGAEQAYNLTVRDFGIDVVGVDLPGLFYGASTLFNVFRLRKEKSKDQSAPLAIPTCRISDWPSIRRRALHMDISSHILPKRETLDALAKFLARQMKMNQLQLNMGPNFVRMSDLSGRDAMRHEDILTFQNVCHQHFIELVPVVSLGDQTEQRQETGDGNTNGNGDHHSGSSQRKKRVEDEMIYDEFVTLFDSPQVNLGELSEKRKSDSSDFERLRAATRGLRSRGKQTFQIYGSQIPEILADSPVASSVLAEIPTRCITILETTLADEDRYKENCLRMSQYGLPFYTCSSSYLDESLAGCTSKALDSSWIAVETAIEQGAVGVMMKNSSSATHSAPLVFLYQALIPFAGAAWNAKQAVGRVSSGPDDVLSHLYDMYIFGDPTEKGILGNIALSLGDLHLVAGDSTGKALSSLLTNRRGNAISAIEGMTYLGLRKALKRAERIENALSSYVGNAERTDVLEMRVAAILMGVSARLGASLFSVSSANSMDFANSFREAPLRISALPDGRRSDLCNSLLHGIELFRDAWMQRYNEVGFTATVELLTGEALTQLADGMPYQRYLEERKAHGWGPGGE